MELFSAVPTAFADRRLSLVNYPGYRDSVLHGDPVASESTSMGRRCLSAPVDYRGHWESKAVESHRDRRPGADANPKMEVSVYRYQFHVQVQMGQFAEFQTLLDALNGSLRAKGLVPFELWEAAVGRFNEFLMVAEYESLGVYEREHFAMHTAQACMNLWREMDADLNGIPWTDLWSRPPGAK